MGRSPNILWCEQCEDWTPCKSGNSAKDGVDTSDVGRREYADGLRAYRRSRCCVECGHDFFTLEISEAGLTQMEKAVASVKRAVAKLSW